MSEHLAWYVARSAGIVAWSLATASILWGLALSTRLIRRRGVPAWLLDLHRFLGLLTMIAVGVHLLGLWADNYVHFGWRELFVPFGSTWRPVAVTWGVVATYFLVAVEVTSWAMRRLPRRLWHTVHLSSFIVFGGSTIHAFQSGTDAMNTLVQWLVFTGTAFVVFLLLFRLTAPRKARRARARITRTGVPVEVSAQGTDLGGRGPGDARPKDPVACGAEPGR